jgi:hypothetical protein
MHSQTETLHASAVNPWLSAQNILVVRLDNLGDVVMTGPALRAVKATSAHARLTLLASTGGAAAAALLPWVDDVIPWRSIWQDMGHLPFDPARERELVDLLAARRFDAALIFTSFSQTPHAAGYVCYLAGIPLRAGESKEFGGRVLTTELRGATDDMHQVERNLRLVESLGFVAHDRRLAVAHAGQARPDAALYSAPSGRERAGAALSVGACWSGGGSAGATGVAGTGDGGGARSRASGASQASRAGGGLPHRGDEPDRVRGAYRAGGAGHLWQYPAAAPGRRARHTAVGALLRHGP